MSDLELIAGGWGSKPRCSTLRKLGMTTEGDTVVTTADDRHETSSTEKPVWLLDVDGVVNAERSGWGAAPRSGTAYADGYVWRLRWNPAVTAFIRRVHTEELVEVRWCTTWCDYADQLERLWRLPELLRVFAPGLTGRTISAAKVAAARNVVVVERRRLIWTDDDEVPVANTELHAELTGGLTGRRARALLIAPDHRRGLQREHLEAIEKFITRSS